MATTFQKFTSAITGSVDVPNAEARAVQARQAVIDGQAAAEAAKAALSAADEFGDSAAIQKAEAGIVAAERAVDRATRAFEIAERKLQQAQEAARDAARADGMKVLRQATERHQAASKRADAAIQALAVAVAELDEADATIGTLQRQGIASANAVAGHNFGPAATRRRIELALMEAGVLNGKPLTDPESMTIWSVSLEELLVPARVK